MNKLTPIEVDFFNNVNQYGNAIHITNEDLSECDIDIVKSLNTVLKDNFNPSIDKASPVYASLMTKINTEMQKPYKATSSISKGLPSSSDYIFDTKNKFW